MQNMEEAKRKGLKIAEKRVAMSYEFEELLKKLRNQKQKSESITENERISTLSKILSQTITSYKLNIDGNQATLPEFIDDEINLQMPDSIENCSINVFDGLHRLQTELDLLDNANAIIDIDSENEQQLNVDIKLKEKSRLTASIGASHDVQGLSQINGNMSVGVRNIFGRGEKLDLSADLGLGTTNEHNFTNMVHNTSNQYSITLTKPRINLPFDTDSSILFPFDESNLYKFQSENKDDNNNNRARINKKPTLLMKAFRQSLDRSRSSSYREDSMGSTFTLVSPDNQHCIQYNYHLRSLIPVPRWTSNGNRNIQTDAVSGSVGDEQFPSVKSSILYRFIHDTRNHFSIPSSGYYASAEAELAGLGGEVDFIKANGSFHYHWTLPTDFKAILNIGSQLGFVMPWKRSMKFKSGDSYNRIIDRIIPFAGLQARGFEHGRIGPKDINDYVHCDFLLAGGLSLTFPIFEWLYANIFVNSIHCGLMQDKSMSNVFGNSRMSAGSSICIPFPVGRLEVGYAHGFQTHGDPFSPVFWSFDVQFF